MAEIWGTIWPVILAILVFGLMIFIHELGHFTAAKRSKIKVNKFALGFGPKLFKFTKGETEYSLRLVPFGGFCAMEGEDDDSEDEKAFNNKPVWKRIIVILAGSFSNILLGFLLFVLLTSMSSTYASTTISKFDDDAISNAQLQEGDTFKYINGSRMYVISDVMYELTRQEDGKFDMVVVRDGQNIKLTDVTFDMEKVEGTDMMVFKRDFYVYPKKVTVGSTITQAGAQTISYGRIVWKSLVDLVKGRYKVSDMSGPIGTVQTIGDVGKELGAASKEERKEAAQNFLFLIAFMTINLGVFNLLPIPGLDGGRFVFLAIEGITRKKVPQEKEAYIHLSGMAALILLIAFVTFFDITKLFK